MAVARKCDRCGKFYTAEDKKFEVNGRIVDRVRTLTTSGYDASIFDLCDECMKDLYSFLNKKDYELRVKNTPVWDWNEAVEFVAERCDVDIKFIEEVFECENEYMRFKGIIKED